MSWRNITRKIIGSDDQSTAMQTIKVVVLSVVIASAGSYVFAAWNPPTQDPTGGNTPAPINVGPVDQVKSGGLSVDALSVFGNTYIDGNLGLGQLSPSEKLDVTGNIRASGTICDSVGCIGGGGGGAGLWSSGSGGAIYYNGGNVGIGHSAPPYSLYVRRNQSGWQGRYANRGGAGSDVYMAHGAGYGMHIRGWTTGGQYTLQLYNATGKTNEFLNNGRVYLGLQGNVGIGTTNPGIAKTYIHNSGSNVGLYVGNRTPFGQAQIELDGPAVTHIWAAENGNRVFSVMAGGAGYFLGSVDIDGVTNTRGGFVIETRNGAPPNPQTGRMWLRTN